MGIMTVTGMSSIVAGLNTSMASADRGLRLRRSIFVRPSAPGENLDRRRSGAAARACPTHEVEAIAARCPPVRRSRPWSCSAADTIKYGNEKVQRRAAARAPPRPTRPSTTSTSSKGRFLSAADVEPRRAGGRDRHRRSRTTLFPYVDPVDKEIADRRPPLPRHRRDASSKGKFLCFNRDNVILVPLGSIAEARPLLQLHGRGRQARLARRRWSDAIGRGARDRCAASAS